MYVVTIAIVQNSYYINIPISHISLRICQPVRSLNVFVSIVTLQASCQKKRDCHTLLQQLTECQVRATLKILFYISKPEQISLLKTCRIDGLIFSSIQKFYGQMQKTFSANRFHFSNFVFFFNFFFKYYYLCFGSCYCLQFID